MAKAQLPKAYLRLDPNVDQTHPDLEGLIRLMCAANRQPHRGRFKSRAVVELVIGRSRAKAFVDRGDLVEQDGRLYLDGWDEWQEGDLTVGDRQRRIRAKRAGGVTQPLPDRDNTVTPALPEALQDRDRPSEALGRKAEDVETRISKENPAVAALLARGWSKVSSKQREMLWEIADRHSYEWVARRIEAAPTSADPIAAVIQADREWQDRRSAEIDAREADWQKQKAAERGFKAPVQ